MTSDKKNFRKIDKLLVLSILALLIFGLIVLYSAGNNLDGNYFYKQLISTVIGLIIVAVILFMDIDIFKRLYILMYLVNIVLLIAVLFFGVGDEWGARSWFKLGFINFQPSELSKIFIVLFLGKLLESHKNDLNKPKVLIKILILAFIPVLLILKQPDFGTALVISFMIFVSLFIAGIDWKYILGAFAAFLVSLPFIYISLDDFQKNRILNFLQPERDLSNTGWQALQGKIAIGSGNVMGKGYLNGLQNQFNFIPEKQTDFIFPVLAEEFGFIGGLVLILLYALMLYRLITIAQKSNNFYTKIITMGFCAMFFVHIFENIGMTLGVMPITGIPLPFFSYGGTFQIINLISVGLIISSSIQKESLNFL
ncbi:MAG: rod shape-determining protein RodA [Finegoldia sp.]|nr:rod shape-determining protein RodA [Finegoldia sp.]